MLQGLFMIWFHFQSYEAHLTLLTHKKFGNILNEVK